DALRAPVPAELCASGPPADDHAPEPHRLPAEVHAGIRRRVRAAARAHDPGAHRRREREDAREEPEVRDPRRVHRRRGAHADTRCLQPDAHGRAARAPLRGRDRLRARLRAEGGARAPRVLIIAPTRELVVQIESDARLLGQFTPFRTLAVYGGIDYAKQREALAAGCDLLVGTPGRLIDYLKQRVWSPRHVEVLVIDEADRMFDMGFIADLRFILRRLPPHEKRQSFLFSATLSFRVLELTWEFMNNPTQITIMPQQKTVERVEQMLFHVGREEKFPVLLGFLKREGGDRILIFTNT